MSKSYHIFYFPFIVKHGGAENAIVKALNSSNFGKLWKRAPQVYKTEEYYDEKMYYHHFVHNALYDNGKNLFYTTFSQKEKESNSDYSLVLHFERTDVLSNQLKFRIKAKGEELFNLDIDKITLDYYFTNIGILSLYINNDKYLWKSHATLTPLAKQDLPTFGYNMIALLKSWCWGSILFYPFKISRFS